MERQQLVQQPHGSRDRIYLEESQVNPQMAQDEQEFAQKLGAQKKKSQQNLAKLMSIGGKKAGKQSVDPAQQKKLEQAAIAQINQATLAGIKKGEEASKKLHHDAKSQSEGETTEAIGKLKDKFDSTRNQVLAIVQNFGQIRSELDDIKQEFLQEQSAIMDKQSQASLVQLNAESSEYELHDIQSRLAGKQHELDAAWENFTGMQQNLVDIEQEIKQKSSEKQVEILQLKNQQDDTRLADLFVKESKEMRQRLRDGRK